MRKYRSFFNLYPCNLFFKQLKSCFLKDMINHHHFSVELIIELLEYRYTKKYDTVLDAHLQAATTFIETSISLNNLMKALQIKCWMQLRKTFKSLNLWLSFKVRLNSSCIADIRCDTKYYYKTSAFLSCQSRDKVTNLLQTTSLPYYREAW